MSLKFLHIKFPPRLWEIIGLRLLVLKPLATPEQCEFGSVSDLQNLKKNAELLKIAELKNGRSQSVRIIPYVTYEKSYVMQTDWRSTDRLHKSNCLASTISNVVYKTYKIAIKELKNIWAVICETALEIFTNNYGTAANNKWLQKYKSCCNYIFDCLINLLLLYLFLLLSCYYIPKPWPRQ